MASSPTEGQNGDTLRQIAASYDSAMAALAQADLELVQSIMDQIDTMAKLLGDPRSFARDDAALATVTESHGRLLTALEAMRAETRASIQQAQKGRKALQGYGKRSTGHTGTRLESLS